MRVRYLLAVTLMRFKDSDSTDGRGTLCSLHRFEDHAIGEYLGSVWLGCDGMWAWEADESGASGVRASRRDAKRELRKAVRGAM